MNKVFSKLVDITVFVRVLSLGYVFILLYDIIKTLYIAIFLLFKGFSD